MSGGLVRAIGSLGLPPGSLGLPPPQRHHRSSSLLPSSSQRCVLLPPADPRPTLPALCCDCGCDTQGVPVGAITYVLESATKQLA